MVFYIFLPIRLLINTLVNRGLFFNELLKNIFIDSYWNWLCFHVKISVFNQMLEVPQDPSCSKTHFLKDKKRKKSRIPLRDSFITFSNQMFFY